MFSRFRFRPKMAAKAVVLIAGLGVMSALANWFCVRSLHEFDRVNATITQRIEPLREMLTQAKIAVAWIGLATYKMAASSDPGTVREANDERAGQLSAAKTWLKSVDGSLPGHSADIAGMLARLDNVSAIADSVYAMRKAGNREQGQFVLEFKFEPALVDAQTSVNRLIDILGGQNKVTMEAAAESKAWTYRLLMGVLIGGTLATVLVAMALTHRTIAQPLQRLAGVMRQIAQGEFDAGIEGLKRADEVGTMARAVLVFRDNAIALREAQVARARARDQAAADKRAALDQFAASFESRILNVAGALAQSAAALDASARSMSRTAEESGHHAQTAATVAVETNAVAGTVAQAIDELSTSMHDIDAQLHNAAGVVEEATRRADVAVANADGLTPAVSDIENVARMVHAIAGQTNLLALNATIEAARAGEAGRGFAVVAQEVKVLAARTTQALADIQARTGSMGQIIDGVRGATQSMSSVIAQVEAVARAITGSVRLQSEATQKIAESVEGAAARTRQVSSSIAGVSEIASRTRAGAQQILEAVADLNRQAAALQQEAQDFVARVRAAA
jgi:methyl-accepting chemotaxis protein